jgi:hypothetical protein
MAPGLRTVRIFDCDEFIAKLREGTIRTFVMTASMAANKDTARTCGFTGVSAFYVDPANFRGARDVAPDGKRSC